MKTSTDSLDRNRLEAVWNQESQLSNENQKSSLGLLGFLQRLLKFFVAGDELQIWQTHDRNGMTLWHAYDPITGRRAALDSEAEMRVWIERHYYQ